MSFNRLGWFDDVMQDSDESSRELVSALAAVADEQGFVRQDHLEGWFEMPEGTLDDYFQGGDTILLTLPTARAAAS